MAKDQNTFAKRMREMQKKRKAEGKRARRQRKKEVCPQGIAADEAETRPVDEETGAAAPAGALDAIG